MSIQSLNALPMTIPFPISSSAIDQAQTFATGLSGVRAQQVRRNTLSVWVVNEYLKLIGLSTDLNAGDSWQSIAKLIDVADLVTAKGTLECRAITGTVDLEQETWQNQSCDVPAEVWHDRSGFVFVQIDEANQIAEILGFLPEVTEESITLNQIQPFDDLFDHLASLERVSIAEQVNQQINQVTQTVKRGTTVFGRWLQDQVNESWELLDNLTGFAPSYAFRSRSAELVNPQTSIVRRGKEIVFGNWEDPSEVCRVTLVAGVKSMMGSSGVASTNTIELGLYPVMPQTQLPRGLTVQIVDSYGRVGVPPQTIGNEELLEFEFDGENGEGFSVVLEWKEYEMREEFVI